MGSSGRTVPVRRPPAAPAAGAVRSKESRSDDRAARHRAHRMPAQVTYVRHAMADTTADQPTEWRLGRSGREAAADLALRLELRGPVARVVASSEPKAMESAQPIADRVGLEVAVDPRLREVTRTWVGPGYRAVAHRYLRGDVPAGWEPHAEVAERVQAVVDDVPPDGDHGDRHPRAGSGSPPGSPTRRWLRCRGLLESPRVPRCLGPRRRRPGTPVAAPNRPLGAGLSLAPNGPLCAGLTAPSLDREIGRAGE